MIYLAREQARAPLKPRQDLLKLGHQIFIGLESEFKSTKNLTNKREHFKTRFSLAHFHPYYY